MRQVSTFYGMWTFGVFSFMKSQDILLLFKMASLHAQEENLFGQMELESNSSMVEELVCTCKKAPATVRSRGLFCERGSAHS